MRRHLNYYLSEKKNYLLKHTGKIIGSHNKSNCQNEYDRIRGYLSNRSILPAGTVESLEKRKNCLQGLGIVDDIKLE